MEEVPIMLLVQAFLWAAERDLAGILHGFSIFRNAKRARGPTPRSRLPRLRPRSDWRSKE